MLTVAVAVSLAVALLGAGPARAGGRCNLRYIFNYDGSNVWSSMQANDPSAYGYVSCSVTPAIARWPGGTMITGADDQAPGFSTWANVDGWGKYSFYGQFGGNFSVGASAMVAGPLGPELVVPLDNQLWYFWAPPFSDLQGKSQNPVPGPTVSLNAPAIARTGSATVIAATAQDHSLWFYWNIDGTPAWGSREITGPWTAYGAPAMTADADSAEVAYIGLDGSLWFDWNLNGTPTWYAEQVSGPGTVTGGLAMTRSYGGTQIAAQGPHGSLLFFWNTDGNPAWHPEQIAGPGTMQGVPAMVAGNNTMEIAVTATDNSLRYYWAYDGTSTWYQGQIAPPGYADTSPAMTRSNGGTEIAVAGP